MAPAGKPLVWLRGEIKTPPFSAAARVEAGYLLRRLQLGDALSLPQSRPMPSIGPWYHELRIEDAHHAWRIMCRIGADAIIIAEVFAKTTRATPGPVIAACKTRLKRYDELA